MAETTLFEQTKLITDPQANMIANVFATSFPVLSMLPFGQITGYKKPFTVVDQLPAVAPRDFGIDFVSDFGRSSTYEVPWKNYGGKLEVDKALRAGNPAGAAMQELMQIQAIAKLMAKDIFEGAGGTSMTGIKSFISSVFTGQTVNGSSSTTNGDLLTLAMMDEAFNKCTPDAIFMSQIVRNRLTSLARSSTAHNIQWGVDQFGVQVMKFNGTPIYTMIDEYTSADILSTTEIDGAGANNNTSSVWLVKFGPENVSGFTPNSPTLQIETANPGTHAEITRLESNVGITMITPRSACQIKFIKQAVA